MRGHAETSRINNILGRAGLGQLDQPGVLAQLGYLVRDHEHFRSLVNACEPEQRRAMYDAMKPYVRFELKPLDVYLSELGQVAEQRQLPTVGQDGQLFPFRPAQVFSDEQIAQDAVNAALAKQTLTLVCAKCTKQAQFYGDRKIDAICNARLAGWAYDSFMNGREICPECLGGN